MFGEGVYALPTSYRAWGSAVSSPSGVLAQTRRADDLVTFGTHKERFLAYEIDGFLLPLPLPWIRQCVLDFPDCRRATVDLQSVRRGSYRLNADVVLAIEKHGARVLMQRHDVLLGRRRRAAAVQTTVDAVLAAR